MKPLQYIVRCLVGLLFCWPLITFALLCDIISNLFFFLEISSVSGFLQDSAWMIDRFAMNAYLFVLNHELSSDELDDM